MGLTAEWKDRGAGWGADWLHVRVRGAGCSKCELQAESLGRRYLYVTEKGLTQAQGFDAPVSTSWGLWDI